MTPLKSRAEKLFNSKAWCDADQDNIRGLEGHIPLLIAFATEIAAEARLAALDDVLKILNCSRTSCPIPCRAMCSNPQHEAIRALNERDVKPLEAIFDEIADESRNKALEQAAKIAERYADAAKEWGFKCDASVEIRALKESK